MFNRESVTGHRTKSKFDTHIDDFNTSGHNNENNEHKLKNKKRKRSVKK